MHSNIDINEEVKKFEIINSRIKNKAFGKVKFKKKINNPELIMLQKRKETILTKNNISEEDESQAQQIEESIKEKLLEKQRNDYNKEIDNLNNKRNKKGRTAAIFNLKEKIVGRKKVAQEAISIIHPVKNIRLFDHNEIKEASVNYVCQLLKNSEPKTEYVAEIKE